MMDQAKLELITAKEFRQHMEQPGFEQVRDGKRIGYELVNGILIDVPTRNRLDGHVVAVFAMHLFDYFEVHDLGHVMTSIHTEVAPDSMRVAHIAFVSYESLKRIPKNDPYMPFSPELVIEVVTAREKAEMLEQKIDMFLQSGAKLVWVVYPDLQKVVVRRPDGTSYQVLSHETLTGNGLLPNLKISLQSIFAQVE
jgi:Uma2 family endonuclease